MKKIIAFALVLSFLMAFVPTSFASQAFSPEKARTVKQSTCINNAAEISSCGEMQVNSIEKNNNAPLMLNKAAMSYSASRTKESGTWQDSPYFGLSLMDQTDSMFSGYNLPHTDGKNNAWALANDYYSGNENWGMLFSPSDSSTNDYARFNKDDSMFVSFDLIKEFNSTGSIDYLENDYQVGIYMYGGNYEDYYAEGEAGNLKLIGSWLGTNALDIKVTAPEDDYLYMFYVTVNDPSLTEFAGWFSMSTFEYDYKDLKPAKEIAIDEKAEVNLGSEETTLFLDSDNVLTYGTAYTVNLEAGKQYAAVMDSSEASPIGGRLMVLDENMDVIGNNNIFSGAFDAGYTYDDCRLYIIPAVTGAYTVVVAGFFMADTGNMSVTVYDSASLSDGTFESTETVINVEELGQEDKEDENGHWKYQWFAEGNFGDLTLAYPTDTFILTGENEDVSISVGNGVKVVLDNAKVGSIWLANDWASATIEVVGKSSIVDTGVTNYCIYNYEGCNAGIYITGDELTIEGTFGILVDNAPVHILADSCHITAKGAEGSFTIATWVTGTLTPMLTFGNYTLSEGNKLAKLFFDADGYFLNGYAVASENYEELHRYAGDPNYSYTAAEYTVTNNNEPIIYHTVTFIDGLTEEVISTQEVLHGEAAVMPEEAPEHEGYTFTGWDNDGVNITENTTITAQYTKTAYTVTFVDGLTEEVISTQEVLHGEAADMPEEAPEHEGYTFTGWDKDGKNIFADTTITALYEEVKLYNVTFIDGFDNTVIATITVAHGKDAKMPEAPTHEGYTFIGWDKEGKSITEDTTITAQYEKIAGPALTLGDANGDGKVNTGDATYILKYIVNSVTLTDDQLIAADYNKDTKVNTGDAVAILKYIAAK